MTTGTLTTPRGRAADRARSRPPRRTGPAPRATRAPMDPRLVERRIAVTRAAGRRRLHRLLVALALVAIGAAAGGVVLSPLLDVDHVDVRGADDRAREVVEVAGIERGAPILLADLGGAEERIATLPWVGTVRVERALPGTIRIVVTASVPVAWARAGDGSLRSVDARGRVHEPGTLDEGDPAAAGLPELNVAPQDLAPGTRLRPRTAARVAASLGPLAGRVAAVTVVDGRAVLRLGAGPEIRLGAPTRLSEKARAAAAVLAAPGIDEVTYVDVSVPAAPVTG